MDHEPYVEVVSWPAWRIVLMVVVGGTFAAAFLVLAARAGHVLPFVLGAAIIAVGIRELVPSRVLRIAIDDESLRLKLGWGAEQVAIERIVACSAGPFGFDEWLRFDSLPRWAGAYKVPETRGKHARITTDDGRVVRFTSRQPRDVCRALGKRNPAIAME